MDRKENYSMNSSFLLTLFLAATLPAPAWAQQQNRPAKRAAVKEPIKKGDTVPMFALRKFEGDFVFLKNYCGASKKKAAVKAVLLDFFATDCTACVAKLGGLQALAGQYADKGLETFLISIDPKPEEALPPFLREKEVTLPVLTDMYRKTLANYGFHTVPQTVLLDGNCKAVYVAKKEEKDFSGLTARLKTLLK